MADSAKDAAAKANMTPATLLEAVQDLETAKEKVTSANGKYQARRKHWKGMGINLKVLDAILTLKGADEADVLADEQDRVRYAVWLNVDLGTQAEFNLEPVQPEHAEKLAKYDIHKQGYDAGKRGDPRTANPHAETPGSVGYVAWDQGWADGEADQWAAAEKKPARKPKKGAGAELGPQAAPTGADARAADTDVPFAEPEPSTTDAMPDIPDQFKRTAGEKVH